MVVAMFLTKDLSIHWRRGEEHFARTLVDYDWSSNNGGWQWSASTGTDAQPYFRVFNPARQSEKFDPDGEYIRQYVHELRNTEIAEIHDPSTAERKRVGYPLPIVDHSEARKSIIAMFTAAASTKGEGGKQKRVKRSRPNGSDDDD
jgi:deoxyribodipyrimidine photo-lyase